MIIGLSGMFLPVFMAEAQDKVYYKRPEKKVEESVKKMETGHQILMADAIDITPQLKIELNEMFLDELLENEDELYPADELYGLWNTERVNPYGSALVMPDSCTIDVSSYYPPTEGYVTSKFGPRKRRFHYGIDLKVQVGDTICAAFDGKIRVKSYEKKGYGNYLVIRHSNGLETVYGHLSDFLVESEDFVRAGQPIALGGNTGRSTGPHLHFETRLLGTPINPAEIIDFENHVAHQDFFVFNKKKSSPVEKYKSSSFAYHRVKKGDTLGKIAQKHGVSIAALCKLNNIKPTTVLRVGSSLRCS